jgi:hypothetical protein
MQSNKIEKEEATRGRSRRRYSGGYSVSRSRSGRSRSKANMAKAAVATRLVAIIPSLFVARILRAGLVLLTIRRLCRLMMSRWKARQKRKFLAHELTMSSSAIAGLVQHYRSKSRGGSRSKSRLRTGKCGKSTISEMKQ